MQLRDKRTRLPSDDERSPAEWDEDTEVRALPARSETRRAPGRGGPRAASTIRVALVEDHPVTRLGLRALLAEDAAIELVAEAVDGRSAIEACLETQPDVVVVDLRLPDMDALGVLEALRSGRCASRLLVLTGFGTAEKARELLRAGAAGFLRKSADPDLLLDAIRSIASGRRMVDPELSADLALAMPGGDLTPREVEILRLMASGATNKEIGDALFVSAGTVRTHVSRLLAKLGASDRTEAVMIGVRKGLIEL